MFISDYKNPVAYFRKLDSFLPEGVSLFTLSADSANDPASRNCVEKAIEIILKDHASDLSDGFIVVPDYNALKDFLSTVKNKNCKSLKTPFGYMVCDVDSWAVDTSRSIDEMTPADAVCLYACLKFSAKDNLLLVRYNDLGVYVNEFVTGMFGMWDIYHGFLLECRSVVFDMRGYDIVSLPFYKFRNMDECEGYSKENVLDRMADAKTVEFTDKLDGSMIQIRFLGNDDRYKGMFDDDLLISTSGSLTTHDFTSQLSGAIEWVKNHRYAKIMEMCRDNSDITFIFEWIHPETDPHIVRYDEKDWGLHLIGARSVLTGEIFNHVDLVNWAKQYDVALTSFHKNATLSDILVLCRTDHGDKREGFVLNLDGWLVKIKGEDFITIRNLIKNVSSFNAVIRSFYDGAIDDIIPRIPAAYRPELEKICNDLGRYAETVDAEVKALVAKAPEGDRDAYEFFVANAPKRFVPFCVSERRGNNNRYPYYARQRGDAVSYMNQSEFEAAQKDLSDWQNSRKS